MDRRWKYRWGTKTTADTLVPQGLPQGGTLSPGLWIAYVHDLPSAVQEADADAKVNLFADDTVIWVTEESTEQCQLQLQTAFDALARYCRDNDVSMNPTKTVVVPFTLTNWKERKTEYTIKEEGLPIEPIENGKFLGVLLDSRLSFKNHLQNVAGKYRRRSRVMRALRGKSWGADWKTIETVRKGFAEPIAFYAAGTTIPNASFGGVNIVERARNEALRIQTGCVSSTPIDGLRNLTATPSLTDVSKAKAALLYEKALRHRTVTPIYAALTTLTRARVRVKRPNLKRVAEAHLAEKGILQLLRSGPPRETGLLHLSKVHFAFTECSKDDPPEKQQAAAKGTDKQPSKARC